MPTDVVMPQMGESIFEGTITKWLKKAGDAVQKDEPLFEISTDKVDAEIPSPVAGVLAEIKVPEGRQWGSTPWWRSCEDRCGAAATQGELRRAPATSKTAPALIPRRRRRARGYPRKRTCRPAPRPARRQWIEIVMPQMGESIFEGTITKWLKKAGDAVREGRAAV